MGLGAGLAFLGLNGAEPHAEDAEVKRLVAFGDSLTAGYGLRANQAFPARLEAMLRAGGRNVVIANAGVSGDTASAGLERLDWGVPEGTHGVLLALGANDALRGIDPGLTMAALEAMILRLKSRGIGVFLIGMRAPRNLGPQYAARFDALYATLADRHAIPLDPFFLEGVAGNPALNLDDGIHPNPAGVDVMAQRLLAPVEAWLAGLRASP
jgi:acyl-CoA thioesterase-1